MPVFKRVNKNFFKKWTPEMAYVLGFFAADGYMTLNKRGAQFWSIEIKDLNLLKDIRRVVESEHKISVRYKGEIETNSKMYRLQIGSIEMCDDLRKLGMKENKTYSLSVPNVPYDYFNDFVRGYFDGDGHVWVGQINKERNTPHLVIQTVFTSCSQKFLEGLQNRLDKLAINKGRLSKGKGNYYRLVFSINGSLKLYNFMYNVKTSQKLFLYRKKRIFEKYKRMRA